MINQIALNKFPLILKRVVSKLGDGKGSAFFDANEEAQLRSMLKLSPAELSGVPEFCACAFETAAYSAQHPDVAEKILVETMGMDVGRAKLLR